MLQDGKDGPHMLHVQQANRSILSGGTTKDKLQSEVRRNVLSRGRTETPKPVGDLKFLDTNDHVAMRMQMP